ncbi:carboxypeptidase-like regulatory domain-containing protein [Curtobacterium pusillum]|uniref:carboxypeptidase-like regulatory domain-containing protein n=1 Tax=Curtobacterium pusillum TaxID=69373 RepID=UPI0011A9964E|nr:carboxypeptidase-like regulatory domain-containing protein [Curtobacterium pusillum]
MRRRRTLIAGAMGLVLGAGLAIGGATSASAAPAGHWGTFTLSGSSKAYTGTMTLPGFPETTFTSNSRQSTVISGASTWQGPSTGPGGAYGSSKGSTYMNQRPTADSANPAAASTTTYTFAEPTPGNGSWSFVLGDIDADQATIAATVQGGAPATAAQLGYQSSYNSCSSVSPGGWSCPADPGGVPAGQDTPTWNEATRTLTGNAAANDTSGATAWFTPTVPLDSLTITYQQRSGFPVYQTWFANRTAELRGTATLDGTPIPGATVTVTAPRGTVYTTTTAADGTYSFPQLPVIGGYTVEVTAPPNADGTASGTASLNTVAGGADAVVDFPFTSPPATVAVIGTVTDEDGTPVSNVPVVITDDDGTTLVDTVTNTDGVYTGADLPPDTDLGVAVGGEDPTPITTGAADAPPAAITPIVAPPAVIATVTGVVTLDGEPVGAGQVVELLDGTTVVGSTTTDAAGRYTFATVGGTYTVRTTVPATGATGPTENTGVVVTAGASAESDLPFVTPAAPAVITTSQAGTVTDTNGDPVAGAAVVATPTDPDAGAPVRTTTGTDGTFDLTGLAPTSEYTVAVDGADPQTITTPESGAAPAALSFTVPAAVVPPAQTPTPTPSAPAPTPPGGGGTGTTPVSSDGGSTTGGALAYTGADLTPGLIAAGVLVLVGAGLLVFRSVRNRRRTSHLQD